MARTLDTELDRAERLLYRRSRTNTSIQPHPFFRWVQTASSVKPVPDPLAGAVHGLVERAWTTAQPQRDFIALSDTTAHGVALVLPLSRDGTPPKTPTTVESVVVACIGPSTLQRTLSIWEPAQSHLYLVNDENQVVPLGRKVGEEARMGALPLVAALRSGPSATIEASRGRYGTDVVGAMAPFEGNARGRSRGTSTGGCLLSRL